VTEEQKGRLTVAGKKCLVVETSLKLNKRKRPLTLSEPASTKAGWQKAENQRKKDVYREENDQIYHQRLQNLQD